MNTGNTFNFTYLVDNIHTDVDALIFLVLGIFHAIEDIIRHIHSRNELLHIPGHSKRSWRGNAGENIDLFIETEISDHAHEFRKLLYIIYDLGLNKVSAVGHLLPHPGSPELKWPGKRICRSAQKKTGFMLFYRFSALKLFVIAHGLDHPKELDGVHVKNAFCAWMIPKFLVIAGQAEQVFQSKGAGAEDVTLHADSIPVSTGHLDDRLKAFRLCDKTGADT